MSGTLKNWRAPIALGTLLMLAGCQTTTPTVATRPACLIFPPITYSSSDTAETVTQVRRHNAGYESYCRRN